MKPQLKAIKFKKVLAIIIAYLLPIIFCIGFFLIAILFLKSLFEIAHNILNTQSDSFSLKSIAPHGFNFSLSGFQKIIGYKFSGSDMMGIGIGFAGFLYFSYKHIARLLWQLIKVIFAIIGTILGKFFSFLGGKIFRTPKSTKKQELGSLLEIYLSFLKRYASSENLSFKNIFKTHCFFLNHIPRLKEFPKEGKQLAILKIPFEYRYMMEDMNSRLKKFIGDPIYAKGPFVFKPDYISFFIGENSLGFENLRSSLENKKGELLKVLPGFDSETGSNFNMKQAELKDGFKLQFYSNDIWDIRKLDLENVRIGKGEILAGFYPQLTDDGIIYKNYSVPTSNLLHNFVVGATRNGKDVFMNNFIFSLIKNIKDHRNYEIHGFDTKLSDWHYMENLESYDIYRYKKVEDFPLMLENLSAKMEQRQSKFGIHSKLSSYLEANPKEKSDMKEVYIIINEMLALFSSNDPKDTSRIASFLINILSKGAGAGFHVILLAQTIRKDIDPNFAKILTNISQRFAVKITNKEEAEIAGRGLSAENLSRLYALTKYNCLHIEDGNIQKEFRAYFITQVEIEKWIKNNLQVSRTFENPKLEKYFLHIQKTWNLSLKEASNQIFNLSRAEWDQFVGYLESNNLLIRNTDNSLSISDKDIPTSAKDIGGE